MILSFFMMTSPSPLLPNDVNLYFQLMISSFLMVSTSDYGIVTSVALCSFLKKPQITSTNIALL